MNNHMARTTLIIDEHRLVELKRLAAGRRETLSAVVDQFLREGLERTKSSRKRKPQPLPPGKDMGRMLVNVADRDQLYDVLDGR
jgi:hypothetical protein